MPPEKLTVPQSSPLPNDYEADLSGGGQPMIVAGGKTLPIATFHDTAGSRHEALRNRDLFLRRMNQGPAFDAMFTIFEDLLCMAKGSVQDQDDINVLAASEAALQLAQGAK